AATHPPAAPPGMEVVTYSPATHALFSRTIAETYRHSLDCPALNGLRDMEDVLAGHKASGEFFPDLWFLCRERGAAGADIAPEPRGVLLLSPMAQGDAVELVYLGLTPAGRGRGLGEWLMRHALASVAAAGRRRLSL